MDRGQERLCRGFARRVRNLADGLRGGHTRQGNRNKAGTGAQALGPVGRVTGLAQLSRRSGEGGLGEGEARKKLDQKGLLESLLS